MESLAVNGSDDARAVLKRILLGKQPSDSSDRVLTIAALRAIVNHLDEENQHVVTVLLAVPESVRPTGRGEITADQLQEECLRLVRPVASADLRLQLAKRINQATSTPNSRRRVLAMLCTDEPVNIGAQIELVVGGQLDPATLGRLDVQLGQTAQQVLDRLLRASATDWATLKITQPSAGNAEDENPVVNLAFGQIAQAARQLWRPELSQALAARLDAAAGDDAEASKALLNFISVLPNEVARKSLGRRLQAVSTDGSASEELSEIFIGVVRDPGLLIAVKELPREAPGEKHSNSNTKPNSKNTKPAKEVALADTDTKQRSAKQTWLKTSEKFVHELIELLAKAPPTAATSSGTGRQLDPVNSTDDFDKLLQSPTNSPKKSTSNPKNGQPSQENSGFDDIVKFHDGARVKIERDLDWPTDLRAGLETLTGNRLAVHYVRLTSESDIDTVVRFYQNQINGALLRTLNNNGRWIDSLTKLDDGQARSVDVLVTRAVPGAPVPHGTPEKINVDILSVQTVDPQDAASDAISTPKSSDRP